MSEPTTPPGGGGSAGSPGSPGHPRDDLAAYALDALPPGERQAVDDHLAACAVCRAELASHHEVLAALTPDEAPPASVWRRIAADIGAPALPDPHASTPTAADRPAAPGRPVGTAPAAPVTGAGEGPGGRGVVPLRPAAPPGIGDRGRSDTAGRGRPPAHAAARSRPRGRSRWMAAGAALAAAAAVAAAFGIARSSGSGDGAGSVPELAQRAAESGDSLGTLTDPDGQPVAEVVAADGASFVVLDRLGRLPQGRDYQLWSLDGPEPVSLGLLGDGSTEAIAVPALETVTQVAISDEPSGGVTAPTGPIVATGRLTRS